MKLFKTSFVILYAAALLLMVGCGKKQGIIVPIPIVVSSATSIVSISDSLVFPYQYSGEISLDSFSIIDRKEKFIDLMLPSILISKYNLQQKRERVLSLINRDTSRWKKEEHHFVGHLFTVYKTTDTTELLNRLLSHPTSIVLAQAAIESAWGTSRFFKEANNPFGIWSFNKDEPRISSKSDRNGEYVYLRKYVHLQEAIDDYFKTIAKGPYSQFRDAREKSDNPFDLISKLNNYSEKKMVYTNELAIIIRKNKLHRFDHYILHPDYIK